VLYNFSLVCFWTWEGFKGLFNNSRYPENFRYSNRYIFFILVWITATLLTVSVCLFCNIIIYYNFNSHKISCFKNHCFHFAKTKIREIFCGILQFRIASWLWFDADTLGLWRTNRLMIFGKTIPLQAWTGPECSRRISFPDFKIIGTWGW